MTDVYQQIIREHDSELLLAMAVMYRNQLVEMQDRVSPGRIQQLETMGLAYRSTNTQLWMYSRLTDKGVDLFNQLLTTLQSRL